MFDEMRLFEHTYMSVESNRYNQLNATISREKIRVVIF